ncbi:hypothetical protein EG327_006236 [Venturia inaequalis]|uniref:Uncharacterized protein n=1 Tax=Venturia inaequalis TaxID=5025 RepID=A0A8H3Z321_VENIN|nr:hypothetical protein EG327_006236 [Venturia inaequalis]
MKLALLILGLTSLLTNALPIASPSQTACYAEKNAQGAWEEVCTGTQWHPPTEEDTIKSSSTPASAPAVNRRAADPARTACYAEIVNGVDTEVCTGDSWVPPAVEVSPATE